MDVLDLLDEAVTKSWDTDDPFFVIDHDKIRALIDVAKAARKAVAVLNLDSVPHGSNMLSLFGEQIPALEDALKALDSGDK